MPTLSPDAAFEHQKYDPGQRVTARDPFVMLLGVLHLVRSVWSFYQENRPIFTYLDLTGIGDPMVEMWGPPLPLIFLGNLVVLTILLTGIGLLLNQQWGWWLAEFAYGYIVLRAFYMIFMSATIALRGDELHQLGPQFDVGREFGSLTMFVLLFTYLMSNRVLRSFGFTPVKGFRLKSVALILAASLAALALTTILSTLIIATYGRSVPWIERPDSVEQLLSN